MSEQSEAAAKLIFDALINKLGDRERTSLSDDQKVKLLGEMISKLKITHPFKVGDPVQWKPGFRNITIKGPFVIQEIFEQPIIIDDVDKMSPRYLDVIHAAVLFIDSEGDVMRVPVNLERLEPYTAVTVE